MSRVRLFLILIISPIFAFTQQNARYGNTYAPTKDIHIYPINNMGHGSVQVNGLSLNAGMYLYSLVVDGRVVDTKRMILTK